MDRGTTTKTGTKINKITIFLWIIVVECQVLCFKYLDECNTAILLVELKVLNKAQS